MPCVFSRFPKLPEENIVLGLMEVSSIAKGIKLLDTMVKRSPVRMLDARSISPGDYIILFSGEVAEVEEALDSAKLEADKWLIDTLFIPNLHEQIIPALTNQVTKSSYDTMAVIETKTVSSAITSADLACKEADIQLLELRLANGLGGKSFFIIAGELFNVEASVGKALSAFQFSDHLYHYEIISSSHDEIKDFI